MTTQKLYTRLSYAVQARLNCEKTGNGEWFDKHETTIEDLVKEHMPSGSGIDAGTKIDLDKSNGEKLVFTAGYHHMNDGGMYDGWTEHTIVVTPSFDGINIKITGRDRNHIKEYLFDVYHTALNQEV